MRLPAAEGPRQLAVLRFVLGADRGERSARLALALDQPLTCRGRDSELGVVPGGWPAPSRRILVIGTERPRRACPRLVRGWTPAQSNVVVTPSVVALQFMGNSSHDEGPFLTNVPDRSIIESSA